MSRTTAVSAAGFEAKVRHWSPRYLAFLGKAAWSAISRRGQVDWGLQADRWAETRIWVLPNPSGLNRGFSLAELVEAYAALHREVEASS